MKNLLLAVPSRNRPASIARLWDAMSNTCRTDTELVVGLDEDDPRRPEYPPGPEYEVRAGMHQVVAWTNELTVPRASRYRAVGAIGDDNVPHTDGWDTAIMAALEKTPFAFGNDLYPRAPGSLCCHVFCRAEVVQALGYFGPPGIRHMYVDVAWMAWGVACGITYLPEVIIEHLHYSSGKSPADESYAASTALMATDLAAWHAYGRDHLNEDITKLGGTTFSPAALAEFNRNLNVPAHWPG